MQIDAAIQSKSLYQAFEAMRAKKWEEAETFLKAGLAHAESEKDLVLMGLYYSAYGVFYKLQHEFKKSWRYYEQAEKLLPDDPYLKIISSRLLVDCFGQYDTAIRKMDKILTSPETINFPLAHQAHTLKGLALFRKGDKKRAAESLQLAMGKNFEGLQSGINFDWSLVSEMVKKKIELTLCRDYLNAALQFVKKTKEKPCEELIQKLLKNLTPPSPS